MNTSEQKSCPRCGQTFGCGVNSLEKDCWCASLPGALARPESNVDCFCPKCLSKMIDQQIFANNPPTNSTTSETAGELFEGADYYWEGQTMVFTASYHLRRGYCCESGCRHCPFEKL
jgi:hypothetical protein